MNPSNHGEGRPSRVSMRIDGWTEGRTDASLDPQSDGRTEEQSDEREDRGKKRRLGAYESMDLSAEGARGSLGVDHHAGDHYAGDEAGGYAGDEAGDGNTSYNWN